MLNHYNDTALRFNTNNACLHDPFFSLACIFKMHWTFSILSDKVSIKADARYRTQKDLTREMTFLEEQLPQSLK